MTSSNSQNILYSDLTLYSVSTSSNVAHNTDGLDIGPAWYVTVQCMHITYDDNCIALKPGASYVKATGVTCIGCHSLSVGSLAGRESSDEVVTSIIFKDCAMRASTKAAGIKYYPGGPTHGT
jgi:galacturan 1,4-alpha-galacturonidase